MNGMPVRYKKIAFLARRPDISHGQFTRHWREIHGPTVAGAAGYAAWRDRYVQNHVIGSAFARPFTYDGMAEFWLPGANEDSYALSETYRAHVRPDELNFIDMDRTVSMTATETVLQPGRDGAKLVVLARRYHRLAPEVYAEAALARSRAALAELGASRVSGSLDLVQEGSTRLPGARASHDVAVSAVWALYFSDEADAAAPTTHEWLSELLGLGDEMLHDPTGTIAVRVTEMVFFEDGRPTS